MSNTTKIKLIDMWDRVFSLDLLKTKDDKELEEEVKQKIKEREEAKQLKNYELADRIREELLGRGIKLIDTREGTIYEFVNKM